MLGAVEVVPVVHEAILVAVLAGDDDCPARSADRVGAKAFPEEHALGSQAVDVRRGINALEPAVVGADGVGSVIVAEDEDDVGLLGAGEKREATGKEEKHSHGMNG